MITCMTEYELELWCGLKTGLVEVYNQSILCVATLEGHKKEVLGIHAAKELVISISKDLKVITWSRRSKVCRLFAGTL